MVEVRIINLGGKPTTQWFIQNENGLIVWATFDINNAREKIIMVGEKKDDTKKS